MSKEQANTFKKFKEADDPMGNLGWASKLSKKALRQAQEAPPDIERSFAFSDNERLLWRLLKVPRKYTDLENAGVLPAEKVRGVMRGLVSADMLDIVEATDGKPIVPMEVSRLKRALSGQDEKVEVKKKTLDERVFRPNIGLANETADDSSSATESSTSASSSSHAERAVPAPVDIPAPARLSLDDQKLKERIVKEHTERLKGNHYTILGLPQAASPADIKKAYVTLAREWHPDTLSGTALANDETVKTKLAELFGRLQDANAVLSHADQRAAYDRSGASVIEQTGGKKVRRTAEANVAFIKAETYLKKKDYRLAETHYRLASDLDEEDPKFRVLLAWAIFQNETKDKAVRSVEAKKILTEVLKQKRVADAAYKLGLIARQDGSEVEAMKYFDEAYKLDPKNPDVQRERRLKDMRADKVKEDATLFGRIKKLTR
jgi:tetratricopeptide (TPR) repeat protein